VETETTMSAGEGPSSGQPHAPGIEENQNAVLQLDPRACRRDGGEEGDDDERREGPSDGGVNPMPETKVPDWILSDFDEGPSSGKEERVGEGEAKWARGLPHICEHKCLATTKWCRGSSEEGVEALITESGNDHDDSEISFSESHCLFTCSIDGA
jgi:hypothetical protein